jgi:hypothetical protein
MSLKIKFETKYIMHDNAVIAYVRPITIKDSGLISINTYRGISFTKGRPPYPNKTFKGVARLKEGDTCNLQTAKNIARRKAVRTAYRAFKNYHEYYYDKLSTLLKQYKDHIESIEEKASNLDYEIFLDTRA